MRTYKCFTLIAAIAITALEVLVFTRASEVTPQVAAQRATASTPGATVNAPSFDSSGDGGSVSGE
jgi:hypothetical protein